MNTVLHDNERSLVIDLIAFAKAHAKSRYPDVITGVQGELGVRNPGSQTSRTLFGDCFIHTKKASIPLEAKTPATPLSDHELLENATAKALRTGSNAFIVWNFQQAILYLRAQEAGAFQASAEWYRPHLRSVADVASRPREWEGMMEEVLATVNEWVVRGKLFRTEPDPQTLAQFFQKIMSEVLPAHKEGLRQASVADSRLASVCRAVTGSDETDVALATVARQTLINWFLKVLSARTLPLEASLTQFPGTGASASDVLNHFSRLLEKTRLSIFAPCEGQEHTSSATLDFLRDFDQWLQEPGTALLQQRSIQTLMSLAQSHEEKHDTGGFATHPALAELLARLTVRNLAGVVLDPCAGSGSILDAAIALKHAAGRTSEQICGEVYGGDLHTLPLGFGSTSMAALHARAGATGTLFQADALKVRPEDPLSLGGVSLGLKLPLASAVVSNLPFIAGARTLDVYAQIMLHSKHLVADGGRVGFLTSNSWLGCSWSKEFREAFLSEYTIEKVIVSGCGGWSSHADVVMAAVVAQKTPNGHHPDRSIDFIITHEPVEAWEKGGVQALADAITLSQESPRYSCRRHTLAEIRRLEAMGVEWNALFADASFLTQAAPHLVPVSDHLTVRRGERRGWDSLYYPRPSSHSIEPEYIKRVLLSSKTLSSLTVAPDGEAFCCEESEESLREKGHWGALDWLNTHRHTKNKKGVPITEVLKQGGREWYMFPNRECAGFVLPVNPYRRFFCARLTEPAMVNQRLIHLACLKEGSDHEALCHALLNSSLQAILIMAAGFGRGQGVLDLNAQKIEKSMRMLDPSRLSAGDVRRIIAAFKPILARPPQDILVDIRLADRQDFDRAVLQAYGLEKHQDALYATLVELVSARLGASTKKEEVPKAKSARPAHGQGSAQKKPKAVRAARANRPAA